MEKSEQVNKMLSKRKRININILLHVAWKNLVSKKLRTFLTIFGITIGIGAIFFLLSFGIGVQNLVTEEIIGNQSIKSVDITSPNSKIVKLTSGMKEKIKNLPHVQSVGSSFSFPGSLKIASSEIDSVVYGYDKNYQDLANLNFVKGRGIKNDDAKVALINRSVVKAIGIEKEDDLLNKKLTLLIPLKDKTTSDEKEIEDSYTIIGIIDSGSGSEVFIPNFVFENAGVSSYTQIKLVADQTENVMPLRKQIESLGLLTTSPADTVDQINQIFKVFNYVLFGFGAIGMIVAVLGMFNTLTVSLLERTKEIGLMMALGARNRDVRRLFIFEAVLLSLVGSLVGILLAVGGGYIVNAILFRFASQRGVEDSFDLFATPVWLIVGLVIFMITVGLSVVFLPARRASKINPIDALRRE